MYHFFVLIEQITDSMVLITGSDVNHIANVLRMQAGEQIAVLDGKGMEYVCELRSFASDIQADIIEKHPVQSELPVKITLFQGFPKGDKLEQIIQKCVELGVQEIVPVMTERTIVKLDAKKAAKRTVRYQDIALSAAKQSGRGILPTVQAPMTYKQALQKAGELDVLLIPYELAENMEETRNVLQSIKPGQTLGIFIGPEGGFAEREVEQAVELGAHSITLGKRILRTETAGPTVMAMLNYVLEP